MHEFMILLKLNIRRRTMDGFAVGYQIIFPLIMIGLLGVLCRGFFEGDITSYHYYGIVTIPFCTALGMITAAYAGKDDAYAKTAQRVLVSPIRVHILVISKVVSCTIVFSMCSLLVMVLSMMVWNIPLQNNWKEMSLLFVSLSFFISAVGTMIGLGMKRFLVVKNLISVPICYAAVVAGTFFRVGTLHKGFGFIQKMSPLTWLNRSIFMMIYDGKTHLLWQVSLLMLGIGVAIMWFTTKLFNQEEYMYGDLPSYEK